MKLLFFDVETTGVEQDDEICQIAYSWNDGEKIQRVCEIFKTKKDLTPVSMAIHHITPDMQEGKDFFATSDERMEFIKLVEDGYLPVAHNAQFDVEMFNRKSSVQIGRYICTLKLARLLDEEMKMEAHNLQYLRYYFGLYNIDATAHDALGDVIVLEKVFEKLMEMRGLEEDELVAISTSPSLIRKMPFGKHKGMLLSEVPTDYVGWLRAQWQKDGKVDEDLDFSFKHFDK